MSNRFQCQACGATYSDACPDGALYFHACGPVVDPKTGATAPRANTRDENVSLKLDGTAAGIKAQGAGVQCLSNPVLTDPQWITSLQKRNPPEDDD